MLPYLDGAAIVAALRTDAQKAGTAMPPIILMTGASPVQTRAAGSDVILRKPFHLADLERLLHRFLAPASDGAATVADAAKD